MTKKKKLYGHHISPDSSKDSLAINIRDILREELRLERWRVGDRFPSTSDLARECRVSRWPVQQALGMLREEGYLRQEERRGTFVANVAPEGSSPIGTIGVVMPEGELPEHIHIDLSSLQKKVENLLTIAAERHLKVEIVHFKAGEVPLHIDTPGAVFSEQVRGIISLFPFPHSHYLELPEGKIPLVFQGPYTVDSLPVIHGDTCLSFYELTKKVIAAGHRSIAMCGCGEPEITPAEAERFSGFESALREASLPIHQDIVKQSRSIRIDDTKAMQQFLKDSEEITALICFHMRVAQQVIAAADAIGRKVPEDVSVVTQGTGPMRSHDSGYVFVGIEPNTDQIIRSCFDLLDAQRKTRMCPHSHIRIKAHIVDGDSLGPPAVKKATDVSDSESVLSVMEDE